MSGSATSDHVQQNLETFSLLWLDRSVNESSENIEAQKQLRTVIHFLKTFDDADVCEKYIQSLSQDDRVVLIVSGQFGQIIVPRIHPLRQLSSIHVFCKDKKMHEQWAGNFKKVKGVAVLLDEIIKQIQAYRKRRGRIKMEEPLSININSNKEQSTSELDGQFIHSQLLLDCLVRMKPNAVDVNELINFCQQYYKDNEFELISLNEFKKYYSSDRALWWYTSESFVYRLMNKAFRVLNTDLLYLFRFVIRDIENQIKQKHCKSPVKTFRCQLMSKDEVGLLKDSIGQCISMNSYVSTSLSRTHAVSFLDYSSDLEQVLFEIEADPQIHGIKHFANITDDSCFPEEQEVLFTFGSIFIILSVHCDIDHLWTIQMRLVGEDYHTANLIINQMKTDFTEGETNIITYGNILRHMGKIEQAMTYYRRFLNQSENTKEDIANCYHALGTISNTKGKFDESHKLFSDSLEIKRKLYEPMHPSIATSYNSLAIIYRRKHDHGKALESYEKALEIWKHLYGRNHPKVASCYTNIGTVYEDQENYTKALEYYNASLQIGEHQVIQDFRTLSATYNNIGSVYYKLGDYDRALEEYTRAYDMKLKFQPRRHASFATAFRNIGMVHEKMGSTEKAHEFYERAEKIDC